MNNPYTNRGTIRNPQEFYGRRREIRRIYSRISSSHPQCISIIGERKIGKSSLLYFINHEDARKKWLKDSEKYVFLLVDLQERTGEMSFSAFFQIVFRMLMEQLDDSLIPASLIEEAQTEARFYESFKSIVSNIQEKGLKLIILFDEFGTITGSDNFDSAFFSFLRSIANNYECAYITTSREKLQNLCRDADISESPFFNIFTPVPLGQLDEEEALSLILTPSSQLGVKFDERETEFVLSVAGYHPLFIQMACSALFDHKNREEGSSGKTDLGIVKADFLVEATEQFENIWQDTDESKQEVLCQIALGEDVPGRQRYLIRELQRRGYVMDDPLKTFSQAFAEFLISKRPDAVHKTVDQMPGQPAKQDSFSSRVRKFFKRDNGKR